MSNIYSIQFLNDLHNHFPEVLYNPGRFRSVQDLLDYIRSVADMNPYTRGLNQYNSRHTHTHTRSTPLRPTVRRPVEPVTPPLPPVAPSVTATRINLPQSGINNILSSMLSGAFGDLLEIPLSGGGALQTFLEQPVVVRPTNEQIESASSRYVNTVNLEEVCTICQDNIETSQEVRNLTHCNHTFHINCIDTWFQNNVRCPTCRHDIRENTPPLENHRHTNLRDPEN
jgi:hypothetical protein